MSKSPLSHLPPSRPVHWTLLIFVNTSFAFLNIWNRYSILYQFHYNGPWSYLSIEYYFCRYSLIELWLLGAYTSLTVNSLLYLNLESPPDLNWGCFLPEVLLLFLLIAKEQHILKINSAPIESCFNEGVPCMAFHLAAGPGLCIRIAAATYICPPVCLVINLGQRFV